MNVLVEQHDFKGIENAVVMLIKWRCGLQCRRDAALNCCRDVALNYCKDAARNYCFYAALKTQRSRSMLPNADVVVRTGHYWDTNLIKTRPWMWHSNVTKAFWMWMSFNASVHLGQIKPSFASCISKIEMPHKYTWGLSRSLKWPINRPKVCSTFSPIRLSSSLSFLELKKKLRALSESSQASILAFF